VSFADNYPNSSDTTEGAPEENTQTLTATYSRVYQVSNPELFEDKPVKLPSAHQSVTVFGMNFAVSLLISCTL